MSDTSVSSSQVEFAVWGIWGDDDLKNNRRQLVLSASEVAREPSPRRGKP